MEAFGNAVTAQNRNSSRFAMFYEVYFSPEMKLSGGRLDCVQIDVSLLFFLREGIFFVFLEIAL